MGKNIAKAEKEECSDQRNSCPNGFLQYYNHKSQEESYPNGWKDESHLHKNREKVSLWVESTDFCYGLRNSAISERAETPVALLFGNFGFEFLWGWLV